MVDKRTPEDRKADLLKTLGESYGVIGIACQKANVSRKTFYNYYNNDPEFKEAADEILALQADNVENKLLEKIEEGDKDCIQFYLKYKGAKIGYIQNVKQELDHKGIVINYVKPKKED